ncbi:MAG: hypothetical protein ACR2QK_19245, partial [Acidimicrobiales bacterium]
MFESAPSKTNTSSTESSKTGPSTTRSSSAPRSRSPRGSDRHGPMDAARSVEPSRPTLRLRRLAVLVVVLCAAAVAAMLVARVDPGALGSVSTAVGDPSSD